MAYHLSKTLVMIGLMGAGKTAIGTMLADRLGVKFRDCDHEMEHASNMTIAELFEEFGEPFFRQKESQVLERLLQDEPSVLSTGGGAYMSEHNRALISKLGVAVWLRADLELLWDRVKHKDTRPLLRVPHPKAKLTELFNARQTVYELAEIAVDAERGLTQEQMTDKVIAALLADPRSGVTEVAK